MEASRNGHLDVVNRLLDCKQIDVNVQNSVSGIVQRVTSHLQLLFSILLNVFFLTSPFRILFFLTYSFWLVKKILIFPDRIFNLVRNKYKIRFILK